MLLNLGKRLSGDKEAEEPILPAFEEP